MSKVLDQHSVIFLNSSWLPIRTGTVRQAILAMNSDGSDNSSAVVCLDITYGVNDDGSWDFENAPTSIIPVKWEDWIKLPIRDYDEVIHSSKLAIRAPTVAIAVNYRHMPQMKFRPSKRTIYERDNGVCQYTGAKLSYGTATIDHVLPKHRGGKDTFENLVLSDPTVNHTKGHKTNKEAGLKLLRQPKAPLPVPAAALIKDTRGFSDWRWFIMKHQK